MWSFVLLRIWPLIDWMESEKRFSVLLTLLIRTLSDFRVSSAGREKTHSNNSFPFFIMKREKKKFSDHFSQSCSSLFSRNLDQKIPFLFLGRFFGSDRECFYPPSLSALRRFWACAKRKRHKNFHRFFGLSNQSTLKVELGKKFASSINRATLRIRSRPCLQSIVSLSGLASSTSRILRE